MSLEGVLNIDKPLGITSHDVVGQIRRISGNRRVGHAGTLDPLATGVILLCVGRPTRLVEYLMGLPKRYVATIRLGQATDTYDAEGAIVSEKAVEVSQADIEQALVPFQGRILQRAPVYSAIKRGGQPLYKLARQGKEVEPPVREVTISELQLQQWQSPYLRLAVACSSGTYIRSLAHDLGQELGCGGHISALRRTAVGEFSVDQAVTLEALQDNAWPAALLPPDRAVQHLPAIELSPEEAQRIQLGQQIACRDDHPDAPLVRVYEPGGRFLGIVTSREEYWQPHKIFLRLPTESD